MLRYGSMTGHDRYETHWYNLFKVLVTYITLQKIDIKPLQLRQAYNEDSLEGMGRSHQKRRAPVSNQT